MIDSQRLPTSSHPLVAGKTRRKSPWNFPVRSPWKIPYGCAAPNAQVFGLRSTGLSVMVSPMEDLDCHLKTIRSSDLPTVLSMIFPLPCLTCLTCLTHMMLFWMTLTSTSFFEATHVLTYRVSCERECQADRGCQAELKFMMAAPQPIKTTIAGEIHSGKLT